MMCIGWDPLHLNLNLDFYFMDLTIQQTVNVNKKNNGMFQLTQLVKFLMVK